MIKSKFLVSALITNVVLLLAALPLVWWLIGPMTALATGAGGVLGMANLIGWSWLMHRMLDGKGPARSKAKYGLLFVGKFGLLLLVIYVAVNKLGLSPYGFLIGLSTMVLSLVIAGFLQPMEEESGEADAMNMEEGKKE